MPFHNRFGLFSAPSMSAVLILSMEVTAPETKAFDLRANKVLHERAQGWTSAG